MVRVLIVQSADDSTTRHVADRIGSRILAAGHEALFAPPEDAAATMADAVVVAVGGPHSDGPVATWALQQNGSLEDRPNALFLVNDEAGRDDGGRASRRLVRDFTRETGWRPDLVGRFAPPGQTDWELVDAFADAFVATLDAPARRDVTGRALLATALFAGATAGAVFYQRHLRPKLHDWGATLQEKERRYVGDETVPDARDRSTYAITIQAPRTDVWPWLVQMGTGRAGWYSYDLLDNGGRPSALDVRPEHQQLHEGDLLPVDPKGSVGFPVVKMEAERHLVLGMPVKGKDREALLVPGTGRAMIWAFHLEARDDDHATRLIVRTAGSRSRHPWADALMAPLTEAVVLFMQRKQLLGIKRRAEALYQRHLQQGQADEAGPVTPAGA